MRQPSPISASAGKFQKPTVFESHTIWDNLVLALKKPRKVFALTYSQSGHDRVRIEEILETVRLTSRKDDLSST